MAHVTLIDRPTGLVPRLAARYSRRRFGRDVEPTMAASHHAGVLVAMGALETAVAKGWKRLDPHLRWLAIQAAAGQIGCSWCTDYGYYEGMQQGIDPQKVRDVPRFGQQRRLRRHRTGRPRVRGGQPPPRRSCSPTS